MYLQLMLLDIDCDCIAIGLSLGCLLVLNGQCLGIQQEGRKKVNCKGSCTCTVGKELDVKESLRALLIPTLLWQYMCMLFSTCVIARCLSRKIRGRCRTLRKGGAAAKV